MSLVQETYFLIIYLVCTEALFFQHGYLSRSYLLILQYYRVQT